jgi:cobalt-zinc-cadmium efflux system outer membrane protein
MLGTGFDAVNNGGPAEMALRVDVPIERGRKRQLRVETSAYAKQAAEARLADAIRRVRLDVVVAALDLLRAKAALTLARDNLRTLEDLVRVNDSRVQAGALPPVERTRSVVAMRQFETNVVKAELDLQVARVRLQQVLGRSLDVPLVDITDDLKLSALSEPPGLAMLESRARAVRPDLRALQIDQARSQADLRLQLAQAKVDVTYGAEYRRQQGISGKSNSLGVFFSAPLALRNRNQGEIARAEREEDQLVARLRAIESQVQGDVRVAWQIFSTARALVASIEQNLLVPATEARDTVAYTYRAGAATLIEFLDAQRAFNETMQSYQEAQVAYRRALIELNVAVGEEVVR